ncbi:hypothetical protein Pmani_013792 [Petrolisthes manimaculis]|uniref:Uncharacterized protein n=1 Tax=Petrolisthes manimaculis TaxID=1843537 RepID=A0AAE1PXN2_9EUCA|nr:hypothetical protein Pmani_013792 [Petrolisthes manimaculis]
MVRQRELTEVGVKGSEEAVGMNQTPETWIWAYIRRFFVTHVTPPEFSPGLVSPKLVIVGQHVLDQGSFTAQCGGQ